jgi:hypothetical protein
MLIVDALKERILDIWGIPLRRNVGAFRPEQSKLGVSPSARIDI